MKLPKTIKRYCPKCKKINIHKVEQYKSSGKRGTLAKGSKSRAKKRGQSRGHGNQGRYSKPAVSKFKRVGAKISKKTTLRFVCEVCKKATQQTQGIRAKKVEIE